MKGLATTLLFLLIVPLAGIAQEPASGQIENLDQLLDSVKRQQLEQRRINQRREQTFIDDKARQQERLQQARSAFEQKQRNNQPLVTATEANAEEIARLEEELKVVTEDMGDLSSTFREFAGDFAAVFQESMLTAQFTGRVESMRKLADADTQVSIAEIQSLWLLLQEDMTEAGKISRFSASVIDTSGASRSATILRLGLFNAWDDGQYLRYVPETGELLVPSRQPPARFRNAAQRFAEIDSGLVSLAIDPTRGSLLGVLGFSPDWQERVEQGGTIGLIIIGLGVFGIVLTLWRIVYLAWVSRSVRQQLENGNQPCANNPLGRVLLAVHGIPLDQEELLQLKLDEAVLAQIPALERGNGLIKLLAATSPLLGLLGTVTGMILTFQAISLFGTGDPKLMAGGISQALVTTVLGLVVAIPLLFGHSIVAFLSRALVQRLDEQSAGVLARAARGHE